MVPEPILLVDDEAELRNSLREALEADGYTVEEASSAHSALARIGRKRYPVVVTDLNMPGGPSGLELIEAVKVKAPKTLCIVITGFATLDVSIEAIKRGAYDFLQKPFKLEELENVLDRALEHARLQQQLDAYQGDLETRVAARVGELAAFHADVLHLNGLLRECLAEAEEGPMLRPLLAFLEHRFAPDGFAMLLPESGTLWRVQDQCGKRPWGGSAALPLPQGFVEACEWGWDGGYPDGHLVPFVHGNRALGALFLGFESRSSFHPEDPVFELWRNQVTAALQVLERLHTRDRASGGGASNPS